MKTDFKFDTDYVIYSYASIIKRITGRAIDIALLSLTAWVAHRLRVNSYVALFVVLLDYIYTSAFIYFTGQTIGMWMVSAKAVSTKGSKITLGQALVRTISSRLSLAVIGMGYIWILFNDASQTWHDMLGETIVVNKDNAGKVQDFMDKRPWRRRKHIVICQAAALLLSINVVFYTAMDKLVNDYGRFGIGLVSSEDMDKHMLVGKVMSSDNGVSKYYAALCNDSKGLTLDFYIMDEKQITVVKSVPIQQEKKDFSSGTSKEENSSKEETSSNNAEIEDSVITDFDMEDLDENYSMELFITRVTKDNGKQYVDLEVYELQGGTYRRTERFRKEYEGAANPVATIAAFKDENIERKPDSKGGMPSPYRLLLSVDSEVTVIGFKNGRIKEDYSTYFGTINSAVVEADFNGSGKKLPYVIQQYTSSIQVNELRFTDKMHLESCGEIKHDLGPVEDIQKGKIRAGDMDGDGRDELILMDGENGLKNRKLLEKKQSAWFNVYSYDGHVWRKLWIGGNIASGDKDTFKAVVDMDGDRKMEIVAQKENTLKVYKYRPVLFKLNSIWIKEYQIVDNILY